MKSNGECHGKKKDYYLYSFVVLSIKNVRKTCKSFLDHFKKEPRNK